MDKTVVKNRKIEKKNRMVTAEMLIDKINLSGLKHNYIADKIGVKDPTFSKFMSLHPDYVTQRMVTALTEFFDKA
jgi:DNA transposition AAA+ family ATPase